MSYLRLTRSYDLGSSPPVWRSSGGGGGIARHIPPLLSARRRGKIDARNFVSIFSTILEGRENRDAARCRTRAKVRELRGSYERHPAGSPSAGTGARRAGCYSRFSDCRRPLHRRLVESG